MDTIAPHPIVDDEIRVAEYMLALRRARWRIASFVAGCMLCGAAAGLLLPKEYTAVIVVAPVSSSSGSGGMSGLAGMASQFGGLASLAGITIGEDTERAETLAVLESSALTEQYIADNNLLPTLFPKLWDPVNKRWTVTDPDKVPTLWKADRVFQKKIRTISTDAKSGIVTMKITWKSPTQASAWANGLVKLTNDYLRAKAVAEAEKNISYLNDQAAKTNLLPVKDAISRILETEINKEMLARGTEEYALKVLDPAQAPERPSSFSVVVWVVIAFLASFGTSLLAVFFRIAWSRSDGAADFAN